MMMMMMMRLSSLLAFLCIVVAPSAVLGFVLPDPSPSFKKLNIATKHDDHRGLLATWDNSNDNNEYQYQYYQNNDNDNNNEMEYQSSQMMTDIGDWMRIITTTPTPGLGDDTNLPLILPLLLIPAGGMILPDILCIAWGILMGIAVVLEATKPPGGNNSNIIVDTVTQQLSRPTPVISNIRYLPLGYPVILALGAAFAPFPTNVAFVASFGGFWVLLFGQQDENNSGNVLAMVTAVLTSSVVALITDMDQALDNVPLILGLPLMVGGALYLASKQQQLEEYEPRNRGSYGQEQEQEQQAALPWRSEEQRYNQQPPNWDTTNNNNKNGNMNMARPLGASNWEYDQENSRQDSNSMFARSEAAPPIAMDIETMRRSIPAQSNNEASLRPQEQPTSNWNSGDDQWTTEEDDSNSLYNPTQTPMNNNGGFGQPDDGAWQ